MAVKAFLLLCFLSLLTQSRTENYCRDLEHVTVGQCCSGGSCCFEDENPDLACCCDEDCFKYGDCCLDIIEIGCPIPYGQQLPNYCSIYPGLYNCTAVDITDGCCVGDDCTISSPSGECCSCDKDCHISSRQDCCPDINTIGCPCNNTCSAHYFTGGCCTGNPNSCHTTCPDYCFCDEMCHNRGDCCSDIEDIGCSSPFTLPPPVVCPSEIVNDTYWPETFANKSVKYICTDGRIGITSRDCGPTGVWNAVINNCTSSALSRDLDELSKILSGNTRLTVKEQIELVEEVTQTVKNFSAANDTHLFPQDVATISSIISNSLQILVRNLPKNESDNSTGVILEEGILDILDNLLEDRYESTYTELQTNYNERGSQDLMENIERYTNYSGQFLLSNSSTEDSYQTNKSNINVKVDIVPVNSVKYNFSNSPVNVSQSGSVSLEILTEELLSRENGSKVAIISSVVRNVGQFLTSGARTTNQAGTDVITAQVFTNKQAVQTGITFSFITRAFKNATAPRCVFWNYTEGNWSEEGLRTVNVTSIGTDSIQYQVTCNSSHATPFVVLVDAHDALSEISDEEYLALEVFSYFGVSISCVCLVITLVFLMMLGKELITGTQYFIHFNLCIALLTGYLIYLFLIDNKLIDVTGSKVGCAFIAGILHYFFLAAFSWMLCEGIMLFLLLVVVFSSISKRWYIFLIIGWGLPIFPVAISAGIIHDAYGVQGQFCWLDPNKRGAIWAFLGPMIAIILVNIFFMILAVRALYRYRFKNTKKEKNEKKAGLGVFKNTIIGTVTLIPLLGVTWLVGVFSVNAQTTVFAWLFVISASSQGVLIFLINILRSQKIKQTVINRCCPKLAKKKRADSAVSRIHSHSMRERNLSRRSTQMSSPYDDGRTNSVLIEEDSFAPVMECSDEEEQT